MALLCGPQVRAQSFDEYKKKSQAQFNSYKQQTEASLNQYRDKINREFSAMLGRPWQLQAAKPSQKNPLKEVPPVPIPEKAAEGGTPTESHYKTASLPKDAPHQKSGDALPPINRERDVQTQEVRFTFMQVPCAVHIGKRITLTADKTSAIAAAWESMSSPAYYALAADFMSLREKFSLCDWATMNLAEEIAFQICGSRTSAESVLLQVWLLSQVGLQARMAKDEQGNLRKAVAVDKMLFDCPTFFCEETPYYITDGRTIRKAEIQPCRFPGTRPLSMAFSIPADVPGKTISGEHSPVDETRIGFFESCPNFCDEGQPLTAFYYHASVHLSKNARNKLYPVLKEHIANLSDADAANFLLSFIQKFFHYREDGKVWQKERYFYAEETLFYEFSDCEDRAILYTRLVRDLLGLKTALVYYPGHLAAAVCFKENVPGDATIVEGKRYVICDPTYIGVGIGREMTIVDRSKAVVIPL